MLSLIEKGISQHQACAAVGVSATLVCNWKNPESDEFKPDFLDRFNRAKAAGVERQMDKVLHGVNGGGEPDWKAAAWWLARVCPSEYGDKGITINNSVESNVNLTVITPDALKQLQERRKKAQETHGSN